MRLVRLTAAAEDDLAEAVEWYEARSPGLGGRLIAEVDAAIGRISDSPHQFAVVHRSVRRALLRRFPYGLFFRERDSGVEIIACFHASRNPRRWKARAD